MTPMTDYLENEKDLNDLKEAKKRKVEGQHGTVYLRENYIKEAMQNLYLIVLSLIHI